MTMATTAADGSDSLQPENRRLRAALAYAQRGWHVFPLHTPGEDGSCSCRRADCTNIGKHPRTMNGLKDATTDEARIRRWWEQWPLANVGVATGSSRLVVVDIDPRHGGDESLRDLVQEHGDDWLDTVTAETGGGGTHYLYAAPEGKVIRNSAGDHGIDLRGDGGYIVAPPSTHVSGTPYTWVQKPSETALQPFPEQIFVVHRRSAASQPIGEVIPMGQRDQTLTSLAGSMRRRGMSEHAILAALRAENEQRCDPPLPDADLVRIARSVSRYAPGDDIVLRARSGNPTYSLLRKILVEPPYYLIRVEETDVRVTAEQLANHRALRVRALEQADIVLPAMKPAEWDLQLSALVTQLETIDAPEDASEAGLIWAAVRKCLAARSDLEERFEQGRPVERDGLVYATGPILREALRTRGIGATQPAIWDAVRRHGATNTVLRIGSKTWRAWAIPVGEVDEP